jgi:hypothetical protein
MVMPFGLTNAPATFQAYINEALDGLLDVICVAYLDDICIYSKTEEEHTEHVRLVLDRLRQFGLYVKLSKCEFSKKEIRFLGFIVGTNGIRMDPAKIGTVADWETPKSFRDVQVFLGYANFYRRFILRYSKVARPITDLLIGMQRGRKSGPFLWTDEADKAFRKLKTCFTTAPILRLYDPSLPIRVETDASGYAIAGIISQLFVDPKAEQKVWHPIAYFSRKMSAAERNYDAHDAELLAIVHCFREWRHYLEGAQHTIQVITDHDNLKYFMSTKRLNRRQTGWAEELAAYDFNIFFRKGKLNPVDGLSRRPDYEEHAEERDQTILPTLRNKLRSRRLLPDHQEGTDAIFAASISVTGSCNVPEAKINLDTSLQTFLTSDEVASSIGNAGSNLPISEKSVDELDEELYRLHCTLPRRIAVMALGVEPLHDEEPSASLISLLVKLQSGDDWSKRKEWESLEGGKVLGGEFQGVWTVDRHGLVRKDGKVYVPDDSAIRKEILRLNHDDPWQGGHAGRDRTIENIARYYWWPGMKQAVRKYVEGCDSCQRMNYRRHKPYGLLQPLPMPTAPWKDIAMDFITDLPPSLFRRNAYDSILVVVDRYSKMVVFIPCTKDIDAIELAEALESHVIKYLGMFESCVSDRGSLFTSGWWSTFCHYWNIKRRLSTAFHPQTDGATERQNQTLEIFLRSYVNYHQDDWARLLSAAQFRLNDSVNTVTGVTPFSLVLSYAPTMRMNPAEDSMASGEAPDARHEVEVREKLSKTYQEMWARAQETAKNYYDKRRKIQSFREGQEVLLSAKNIRVRKPCKKLTDRFLGPFRVIKKIGENAYQLELPECYGRLHNTFHVSLLEPYVRREGEEPPGPVDIEEDKFLVESILDERSKHGKPEFLIKWLGYPEHESTWEPLEHLDELEEEIAEFRMRRMVASKARSKIKSSKKQKKKPKVGSKRRPRGRPRKGSKVEKP